MANLDVMTRISAMSLLLMLALLVFTFDRKTWPAKLIVLLCLSLTALLLSKSSIALGFSRQTAFLIGLFDVPNTILVWLFVRSLLIDNFKMDWRNWLIAISWCVPLWFMRFDFQGYFDLFSSIHVTLLNIYAGLLFLYLAFTCLRDWPDDLIQKRRQFRQVFIISIIVMALLAIGSELVVNHRNESLAIAFKLIAIFPPLIAAYFWLFQMKIGVFEYTNATKATPVDRPSQRAQIKLDEIKRKLNIEMIGNEAWRETALTIPKLAKRLGTTQHALRALINQELGHTNFRDYINQQKIAAVKAAFDDPKYDGSSILVLALENGFNTLPPFNRAFKAQFGVTPSDYRKAHKTEQ